MRFRSPSLLVVLLTPGLAWADPPPAVYDSGLYRAEVAITSHQPNEGVLDEDQTFVATITTSGTALYANTTVILFDVSQSTLLHTVDEDDCGGDLNDDGIESLLDCQVRAAGVFLDDLVSAGADHQVGMVFFERETAIADVRPTSGAQAFTDADADLNTNSVLDLYEVFEASYRENSGLVNSADTTVFSTADAGKYVG